MRDSTAPNLPSSLATTPPALPFRAGGRTTSLVRAHVAGRRRLWDPGTVRGVPSPARAHAPKLHGPLPDVWRWPVPAFFARDLLRPPWTVHSSLRIRGLCGMAALERRAARRADHPCSRAHGGGGLGGVRRSYTAAVRHRPA